MPMQMRHHVAQAGEIHLVGTLHHPDGTFGSQHNIEKMALLGHSQIAHLRHMSVPHHPAESGKEATLVASQQHDTA